MVDAATLTHLLGTVLGADVQVTAADRLVGGRLSPDSLALVTFFEAIRRDCGIAVADERLPELLGMSLAELAAALSEAPGRV